MPFSQCLTPDVPCDVTSRTSTLQLFDFANDVFGSPPDIVIANAGVNEVGHLEDDVVLGERIYLSVQLVDTDFNPQKTN